MFKKIIAFIKANKFLLFMILLLILVREGMVIFDMWLLEEGGDLPEGLISGNFAFDILDGAWRGWDVYLYFPLGNMGNELMTSFFAIPLYILFGNSLFVLCQVQILSSIAILLLMYYFCKRYFGANVARIASLLFVCFPISVQRYLIYANYNTFDNFLYTLLAFLFLLKIINSKRPRAKVIYSSLLGFVFGIGYFQTDIYILTIGWVLLFWFLKDDSLFIKKEFFAFLLGLSIGLIPSFYFNIDWHIIFLRKIFTGGYGGSYDADRIVSSYRTTLGLMSMAFWPIKNLSLSIISAPVVTIIGIGLLFITSIWVKLQKKFQLPFTLIILYALSFLCITLVSKASVRYYLYPLMVPTTILLSILICNIQAKWFVKGWLKVAFYTVLFLICFVNIYEIVQHFDFKNTFPRLKKQLSINGCNFYWPYGYFPPDGLKTKLTVDVETIAAKTRFGASPIDESIPQKKIFISKVTTGRFPLTSPESYMVYGKDVSFAGLEQLAKEIKENVPKKAKPFAYQGLAVYYVNDNWLRDLLKDFKVGVIEKNIPEEFQRCFYEELARKIFSRYRDNPARIDKILNMFEDEQKEWVLNTKFVNKKDI